MIILGLTGSIGMGKTATAAIFRDLGLPVFDADAVVHDLYGPGGAAVGPVGALFPGMVEGGSVDRARLGAHLARAPGDVPKLEAVVHPLVVAARGAFLAEARAAGAPAVVLDIPLLLETGGENAVDVVIVASAPERVQRARVLARPGMTVSRLDAILARQLPDSEKRRRADFVIETDKGPEFARFAVEDILKALNIPAKPSIVGS